MNASWGCNLFLINHKTEFQSTNLPTELSNKINTLVNLLKKSVVPKGLLMLLSKHQATILTTIWRLEVTSLEISTPKVPIFAITSSYQIKLHHIHHLSLLPKGSARFHRLLAQMRKNFNFWDGSIHTQDMVALWVALMYISSFSIKKSNLDILVLSIIIAGCPMQTISEKTEYLIIKLIS